MAGLSKNIMLLNSLTITFHFKFACFEFHLLQILDRDKQGNVTFLCIFIYEIFNKFVEKEHGTLRSPVVLFLKSCPSPGPAAE